MSSPRDTPGAAEVATVAARAEWLGGSIATMGMLGAIPATLWITQDAIAMVPLTLFFAVTLTALVATWAIDRHTLRRWRELETERQRAASHGRTDA